MPHPSNHRDAPNRFRSISHSVVLVVALMVLSFSTSAQEKDSLKIAVADSARQGIQHKLDKTDSIKNAALRKQDSLRNLPSSLAGKFETLKGKVLSRTDSIKGKSKPSFSLNADSLRPKSPTAVSDLSEKAGSVQQGIDDKRDGVQQKVNSSLSSANEKAQQQVDKLGLDTDKLQKQLPDAGLGDMKLPDTDLPDLKLPQGTPDLPQANLPALNSPSLNTALPETPAMPNANLPSGDVGNPLENKSGSSLNLPDLDGELNTDNVEKQIEAVGETTSEIQEQVTELKEIKESGLQDPDKLAEQAEQKVSDISEVQAVNKEIGAVAEKQKAYEAMVAKYKDKKVVIADMKRKMVNVANDQINQYTPQVKEAQTAMAKQKGILAKSGKVKGAVKKKENILGSKPFGQRVIPGITLQTMKREDFVVDLGLQAAYRLTERLSAGGGLTYTIGFNKSYDYYARGLGSFGTRAFGDFLLVNGFFVHGEFVWGQYRTSAMPSQETPPQNMCGFNTGLGKQFNLSKRVKGTMMALYRVEFVGKLPQQSKINVRFGFDLYPKRKKKIQG
jgi:hypothetical protein